jgi:hypothetical protein
MFISLFWFIQAVLILLTLATAAWVAKITLDIVRYNLDDGINIWFKFLQMNENIKDRILEHNIEQDKADLVLESVRQELRLKSGLNNFVIAGLEADTREAEK